ncbi:MAG TPA: hypothetical protein VJU59_02030, partial [Paraburkholderia sp.]|uniref:hypothetical protein n=1 Tax=Paraburkholderia sp. TaxID=1926495 RepID=UPI002B49E8E7
VGDVLNARIEPERRGVTQLLRVVDYDARPGSNEPISARNTSAIRPVKHDDCANRSTTSDAQIHH